MERPGSYFGGPRNAKRTAGRLPQADRRAGPLAELAANRDKRARLTKGAASQPERADTDAGAVHPRSAEVGAGVSHSSRGDEGDSREGSSGDEGVGRTATASHGGAGSMDSQPIRKGVIVITDSDTAPLLAPTPATGQDTGA